MKPMYVYRLRCPLDKRVRYIGISATPRRRYGAHRYERSDSLAMREWVASVKKHGLLPLLEVVAYFEDDFDAVIAERRLIFLFSLLYPGQLFNQPIYLRRSPVRKSSDTGPMEYRLSRKRSDEMPWRRRLEATGKAPAGTHEAFIQQDELRFQNRRESLDRERRQNLKLRRLIRRT